MLAIALAPAPSTTTASNNPEPNKRLLLVEEVVYPKPGKPSFGLTHLNNDFIECVAFVPPRPKSSRTPSLEEIVELMRQIPYFTKRKSPVHNMRVFFSATQRVLMDLERDLSLSFAA